MAGSENCMLISDDVFHFQVRHTITAGIVMALVMAVIAIITVTAREV